MSKYWFQIMCAVMIAGLLVYASWPYSKGHVDPAQDSLHHWQEGSSHVYPMVVDWVCDASGRSDDVHITLDSEGRWSVYVRGSAYGDFISEDQAKQQGVKMYKIKELSCP